MNLSGDIHQDEQSVSTPTTINIDQYQRKCKYKISEFALKIDKKEFEIPGDPNSKGAFDVIFDKPDCAEISAEFIGNGLEENVNHVILKGPILSSTCSISVSKKESYDREFGYIQTSKRLSERQFEKAIWCSDFHGNLLHDQDEVLDSDGRNNPFYDATSYYKVPAGCILSHPIELKFIDNPNSNTPKLFDYPSSETSKYDWGCLVKQKRYQQFFVYLVMKSMQDNEEKWNVLFSFDWFIYLKWSKATPKYNSIFIYNCGLNEHKDGKDLPKSIYSKEFYVCNDDQFDYWIDRKDCIFHIDYYPKSIYKSKLERIYDNIKRMVSNAKNYFKSIRSYVLNAKKLLNTKIVEFEEENHESISNKIKEFVIVLRECIKKMNLMKSEDYYQCIDCVCRSVENICNFVEHINFVNNKYRQGYTDIDVKVNNLDTCIGDIDLGIIEYRESSESISSKVINLQSSIKVMNSIEYEVCKGIECLLLNVEKLYEHVERRDLDKYKFDINFESFTCEVKCINQFIENLKLERETFSQIHGHTNLEVDKLFNYINIMNNGEHNVYEGIECLLPNLKKLCETIEKLNLKENAFIEYYRSIDVSKLCVFIDSMDVRVPESRENSDCIASKILKMSKCFESLNAIEHEVFKDITELFKDFEKLNLKNNLFGEKFSLIAVEINKLYSCIEIMELEKYSYRENVNSISLDVNKFPTSTENMELIKDIFDILHPKIEKLSTEKTKDFEKSKFCKCNNLSKSELREKTNNAIIQRNNKEKNEHTKMKKQFTPKNGDELEE